MFHFDLKQFSVKRTQIMGIAMICVVIFHSGFDLSAFPILSNLKQWGDVGVDIFLVMSGIGIYHSLQRKPNVSQYLRNRLLRILPAHLIVCGCWFFALDILLYREGILTFLMDVTSLNFWINGHLTTWYLSSLLVMQILTPAYIEFWKKHPRFDWISILLVYLMCLTITYTPALNNCLEHLLIFFYRIPSYLVGLSLGRKIYNNRSKITAPLPLVITVLFLSIGVLMISSGLTPFYLRWVLRYAAYLPLALMLCAGATLIPQNGILHFWGTRSLEIYLLHEKILWILSILSNRLIGADNSSPFLINLLAILLSCFGAQILHKLLSRFVQRKES